MGYNGEILKTIYFVRHGESKHNLIPVFQPSDSKLSKIGFSQANIVGDKLKRIDHSRIISSPMPRALETAKIISSKTKIKVDVLDLFKEVCSPTSVHDKPYTDSIALNTFEQWMTSLSNPNIRIEDSENFEDLLNRVDKALEYLKLQNNSSIIVISHGYFIRMITARVLLGKTLKPNNFEYFHKHIKSANTGITTIYYCKDHTGKVDWRLISYNDSSHLDNK